MIKNYFISAVRNLLRNRAFTVINILGLVMGIGCSIVLFTIVKYHLSFNEFISDRQNVYRAYVEVQRENNIIYTQTVPHPLGAQLRKEIDDIKLLSRVYFGGGDKQVNHKSAEKISKFREDRLAFAEQDMLKILELEWLAGVGSINDPGTIVISRSTAEKYFDLTSENQLSEIIGENLIIDNVHTAVITGIYKDIPDQSDFPFGMIANYEDQDGVNPYYGEGKIWKRYNGGTTLFFSLHEAQDPLAVQSVLDEVFQKYNDMEAATLKLQPLSELHYDDRLGTYAGFIFDTSYAFILSSIAFLLIFASSINFINLTTAKATQRAKEVGIRKVMGSSKTQLIFQNLIETFIIVIISMVLSLVAAELLFKWMQNLLDVELSLISVPSDWLIVILLSLALGITVITGVYPAYIVSSFTPVEVLRSNVNQVSGKNKLSVRRLLVIVQFFISFSLIIGTITLLSQQHYLLSKDLGFRQEGIISIKLPKVDQNKTGVFMDELRKFSEVEQISAHLGSPIARTNNTGSVILEGTEKETRINFKDIDEPYFDLFEIELIAGKNLSKSSPKGNVVISNSAVKQLGFSSPEDVIGQTLTTEYGGNYFVIGVVKDFNTFTLHSEPLPAIFQYRENMFFEVAVRLKSTSFNNISNFIDKMEGAFDDVYPQYTIEFDFYDDFVEQGYRVEKIFSSLLQFFSYVAIIIGALGLYGLIDFMAIKKTKEIGIRKVLGADVFSILKMFFIEILILIGIAGVFAIPIMYYLLNLWLEQYAYRIDIGFSIIILSVVTISIVALLTSAYRALQASFLNPVDTLKDE